jgi:hypothetical protein
MVRGSQVRVSRWHHPFVDTPKPLISSPGMSFSIVISWMCIFKDQASRRREKMVICISAEKVCW